MKEKKRVLFLAISVFFLFSLLIGHYFKIQIVEGDKWTKQALLQHQYIVKEPCKRGGFFSNPGLKKGHIESPQPFVIDVTKFHLMADSSVIPDSLKTEVAQEISHLLGVNADEIQGELNRKSRSRKLAGWVDRDKKEAVLRWWMPFARKNKIPKNGLFFLTDYKRSYPYGKLLGQVLHTIRDTKDEVTNEGVPTGGLESFFNTFLKGKQGKRILLRSPHHSLESDLVVEDPEDGADIYLTVNHFIQAIAEEELEKGVKAANAKGGWAVMMDPYTGAILALAQYPSFEPAFYRDFFNDPEKLENAKVKAVTDAFELGSIMKPITLAICMKANDELVKQGKPPIFDPLKPIDTTRSIFPGRGNKPLKDRTLHKKLNMAMAIQKSSNVYMAVVIERVIQALGNEWYRRALVEIFGFGQKTGIELPGEAVGLVPTPGKIHPNGVLEWSLPTPVSLAMGYNILATPMQMLRAYAVFANGGSLVQPTLVSKIVKTCQNGDQNILLDHLCEERKAQFSQVLSHEQSLEVVKAIKFVTKPGGSSRVAEIYGYTEAGKTGTAEKVINGAYSKKIHITSFIGFAPANLNPAVRARFVLMVSIDEPEYRILEDGTRAHMGGRSAGPVFREIARRTLEYLGEEPDDPFGYPAGDPRFNPDKADWMKEVRELKLLYEQWNKAA